MLRIYKDQSDDRGNEDKRGRKERNGTDLPINEDEDQGGQQLDRRVPRRDRNLAISALSSQQQPAQYRNVIVRLYLSSAFGTCRVWKHDRLFIWHAVNYDVQEAANGGSEQKSEDVADEIGNAGDGFQRLPNEDCHLLRRVSRDGFSKERQGDHVNHKHFAGKVKDDSEAPREKKPSGAAFPPFAIHTPDVHF